MEHSKLRSKGRWIAAICVLGLGTTLLAQTSSSSTDAPAPAQTTKTAPTVNPSRVDIFLGYSYLSPHGYIAGERYHDVNIGAIGSGAWYFNKNFGLEATVASHPDGPGDGFTEFSLGPIVRFPTQDVTPFLHANVGGVRMGGPNFNGFTTTGAPIHMVNPYTWGTVLTAGGGMDYRLGGFAHRLSWRVFQADYQYMHTSFGPLAPQPLDGSTNILGGRANINAAQLSSGLVFHMGSIIPPPPVAYTCSASPSDVYPGDPVTVTGNAQNLNPKKTASYSWTSSNAKVTGTSSTANVDTADLAPGTYTVAGHVTEGAKAGESADCNATFTVKAFEPPTVSCSANPSTVNPGESSTITAQGVSPQNRPLTYSYSASSGQISGSTSTATLNTTGAAEGVITVTCNVSDDKGQTASATTSVTVNAPAPPPAPKTETLCSINFTNDKRRPTRVDNEAKACLDDVALNLQRNADAKAVLVGNGSGRHADREAAERAVNTKAYLVNEKGIDSSRIDVRTGTAGTATVQNYLVPSGANFDNDVPGTTEVNTARVKASRNAYGHGRARSTTPHHHHHRAAKAASSSTTSAK
jgi:hypothetical protein